MSAPTIYLDVEGKPTPISQCQWVEFQPCGCASGVTMAGYGDTTITTAEQAAEQFAPNKVALRRDVENGLTHRLVSRETFDVRTELVSECPHEPKWGIPTVSLPEGHMWATRDQSYGRHTWTKHIVPSESVCTERNTYPDRELREVAAMCGAVPRYAWHADDEWVLRDCVTCRKCEKAAS